MTLGIPSLFPSRQDRALINFNYLDVIRGQGYGNFYLTSGLDATASTIRKITLEREYSGETSKTTAAQTAPITEETLIDEEDWDLIVGTNQTINGIAPITISWQTDYTVNIGGKSNHFTGYIKVVLTRLRGAVETTIGTGKTVESSKATSTSGTHTNIRKNKLLIDCTRTRLSRGDTLRITVQKYISDQGFDIGGGNNGSSTITYYTDPLDTLATAVNYNKPGASGEPYEYKNSKTFKASIPFEINLE